jgi:hypothetical protein
MLGLNIGAVIRSSHHPDVLPGFVVVARFAIPAETPTMRIFAAMARMAVLGCSHIQIGPLRMTRLAVQVFVSPVQGELGFAAVIECPNVPSIGIVTLSTSASEGLFVRVVLCVAVDAIHAGVVELRACVAFFASQGRVKSEERKTSQIVVKEDLRRPGRFVVAGSARSLQLPAMNIFTAMT